MAYCTSPRKMPKEEEPLVQGLIGAWEGTLKGLGNVVKVFGTDKRGREALDSPEKKHQRRFEAATSPLDVDTEWSRPFTTGGAKELAEKKRLDKMVEDDDEENFSDFNFWHVPLKGAGPTTEESYSDVNYWRQPLPDIAMIEQQAPSSPRRGLM